MSLGIKQSLWSLLASLIVIVIDVSFPAVFSVHIAILASFVHMLRDLLQLLSCYHENTFIQPYYDQRGESNPEFAYKNADPDEQLFEDRAAEETPVKTKESRKKGKTIS